ncbi:hypothetical protein [Arenibaculum pallidiluteum]|uniref:hypothetical protein n=1 Tax=Arenibaculum pallidiluteum TaxID=2812559 RepID=UPI001A95ED40|nr:hypothetical protein [Arenibaculum pallidiluteum]
MKRPSIPSRPDPSRRASSRNAAPAPTSVEDAAREAALRSREVAALRDRLRRMAERPETAEALARAMKALLRQD